ncbi:MAG TPA: phage integrase SAM-like domain-containing protein [Solirubrobacterales bacterium]|nr:phage integrase SAM-like domain-containing protein [Solirubrobacterales bacterium]
MSISQDTSAPAAGPGCGDKRRLRKTKTPGVFKRLGAKGDVIGYVCVFRSAGRQRKRSAPTYEEARRIKRESETDRDRGELQGRTTITFLRYLDEWVERHRGQGRRGFRENTRDEYRRLIGAYVRPYFSGRLKLTELTTYELARFLDWLADEGEQRKRLSDRTIANISMPIRAALATAKREGLIRHNPAQGLALPQRERVAGDEEEIKVFSRDQLAAILAMAPEHHRPLFELLATCGLRISEAIALQRLHLQLDASEPEVCIRRAIVRERIEPPKSKHGRREVRRWQPSCAPTSLRSEISTQLPSPFPTRAAGRSTQTTCAAASSSRSQRRSTPLGWLPHVPPHLCLDPSQPRDQPPPTKPRPRPPLTRLHADPLHASAAGG